MYRCIERCIERCTEWNHFILGSPQVKLLLFKSARSSVEIHFITASLLACVNYITYTKCRYTITKIFLCRDVLLQCVFYFTLLILFQALKSQELAALTSCT